MVLNTIIHCHITCQMIGTVPGTQTVLRIIITVKLFLFTLLHLLNNFDPAGYRPGRYTTGTLFFSVKKVASSFFRTRKPRCCALLAVGAFTARM